MSDEAKYVSFLRSYRDAGRKFAPEQRLKLYEAILDYGLDGIEPTFDDPALAIAWTLIQPNIAKSVQTWRQRSEAGKAGAGTSRNRGNQNAVKTTVKQNNTKTKRNNTKQNENKTGIGIGEGEGEGIGEEKETNKEKERPITKRDKAIEFWKTCNGIYPAHRRVYEPSERALTFIEKRALWEQQDAIIASIQEWILSDEWRRDEGKYVPRFARFIEEGRYQAKPETELFPSTKPRLQTENYDASIADLVKRGVMKPPPGFNPKPEQP